jgi:hypothetical protein
MNRRETIALLGGAAAWPLTARAQQPARLPVIGFLSTSSPGVYAARLQAFQQGLSENGYVDGRNVAIQYRWAVGQYDRMPALAAELVGLRPAVLIASNAIDALALICQRARRRANVAGKSDVPRISRPPSNDSRAAPKRSMSLATRSRISTARASTPSRRSRSAMSAWPSP